MPLLSMDIVSSQRLTMEQVHLKQGSHPFELFLASFSLFEFFLAISAQRSANQLITNDYHYHPLKQWHLLRPSKSNRRYGRPQRLVELAVIKGPK